MTLCRKIIVLLCSAALVIGMLSDVPVGDAARAPKLSVMRMTIKRGQSLTIKLRYGNKKAKVKWATTKRKVAFITKKNTKGNKAYVTVKGSKAGNADITATYKLGSKKSVLRCKLAVKDMADVNNSSNTDHETLENTSNSKGTMAPAAVSCTAKPKPTPWKYTDNGDEVITTTIPSSTPKVTASAEQTPGADVTPAPADKPTMEPTVSPSSAPTVSPSTEPVPDSTAEPVEEILETTMFTQMKI